MRETKAERVSLSPDGNFYSRRLSHGLSARANLGEFTRTDLVSAADRPRQCWPADGACCQLIDLQHGCPALSRLSQRTHEALQHRGVSKTPNMEWIYNR